MVSSNSAHIGASRQDASDFAAALYAAGFPAMQLSAHPVTAIEGVATNDGGVLRGVCRCGCLGCCEAAVHPTLAEGPISVLSPELLSGVLMLAEAFRRDGFMLLSDDRLNLFSGSNELDLPGCLTLRRLLSQFYEANYAIPLGGISSDIVFHVSDTAAFRENLAAVIGEPLLWDNLCVAIDEQLPFPRRDDYERYMEDLAWVWDVLRPVLRCELNHARRERIGEPRVIVNFLVPDSGFDFGEPFRELFPGGPARATTYTELISRYVAPFVGEVKPTGRPIPRKHIFTTAVACLGGVAHSSVFVSAATYAPVGRGSGFVKPRTGVSLPRSSPTVVRTKIYPYSATQFAIAACPATSPSSEGAIEWPEQAKPNWVRLIESFVIETAYVGGVDQLGS